MTNTASAVAPSDDELRVAIDTVKTDYPSLGIIKLLAQLKVDHPGWTVSEKRFRKVLSTQTSDQDGLASTSSASASATGADNGDAEDGPSLVAQTGIDPSIDIESIAPKVKVKMFPESSGKGKGLVGKEKIQKGEVIWQEEPWIVTADPDLHQLLTSRQMCTQCLTLFPHSNPALSISCPHCASAHFCNRLCASKAKSSGAHLDLLCPGLNPGVEGLKRYLRQSKSRSTDAVVKIIARWRAAREAPDVLGQGQAQVLAARDIERRVWEGMARVNQQTKEAERNEWPYVGEQRMKEWHHAHSLVISALNPTLQDEGYKSFQRLMKKSKRSPLSAEEVQKWFSFESFLQLLGLVGLNQEDSGGLYALHAHLNHSCDPNIQVRNLPKSFVPPSPSELPHDLPPPLEPGVRGTNRLTILARKTIHPGDELQISYVNLAMPRAERRKVLREQYGFWCACPRCLREKKDEEKEAAKSQ